MRLEVDTQKETCCLDKKWGELILSKAAILSIQFARLPDILELFDRYLLS